MKQTTSIHTFATSIVPVILLCVDILLMCLLGRPDTTCSIVYTEDKSKDNACTLYVKLYKQYRTVHIYTYVCFSLSIIVIRFVASVKTILIRYTLFRECKQVGLELVTNHQKCFMILKSRFAITNSCNSFKQLNNCILWHMSISLTS